MRIKKFTNEIVLNCPIYGAGADIAAGSAVKVGTTAGTDNGMLIAANGASAIPDIVGVLGELHDYSVDGDTLIAGTNHVVRPVYPFAPLRVVEIEFESTGIVCTEAVSTTTLTLTSLEDNIDAAFLYVSTGLGAGQTNYLTASASGSCTLKAAFGTSLDTTSYVVKLLPRFHDLISLSSDGTKLATQAAAGAVKGMILDLWIERNGKRESLDPTKHAALTGLNGLRSVKFGADVCFRDTFVYTVD